MDSGDALQVPASLHAAPKTSSSVDDDDLDMATPVTPLDENERMLSLQMLLKLADLGHLCMPSELHTTWLKALEEEVGCFVLSEPMVEGST